MLRRFYPDELAGGEADGQQREGKHHAEVGANRCARKEASCSRAGTGNDPDQEDRDGNREADPEDVGHERGRDYRNHPPNARINELRWNR